VFIACLSPWHPLCFFSTAIAGALPVMHQSNHDSLAQNYKCVPHVHELAKLYTPLSCVLLA